MPEAKEYKTNGYRLLRLKSFSEISKWFLGGVAGVLLFTHDKIHCDFLKNAELIVAGICILFFTIAFIGFKKASDKLESQVLIFDDEKHSFSKRAVSAESWPPIPHGLFVFAMVLTFIYIFLAFVPEKYLCKCLPEKENFRKNTMTIINNRYSSRLNDSLPEPPPQRQRSCTYGRHTSLIKQDPLHPSVQH